LNKKLISDEIQEAYKERFMQLRKHEHSTEGDRRFISRLTAVSEQISNLHVKAKVGDFVIENDGPKELGCSGHILGPISMFLASFANCLEITALLYLSFSNAKVNSIRVKVEATIDRRSALNPKKPFPGLYDIKYCWYVNTEENLKKIDRILKKAEEICPVKGTVKGDFEREIHLVKDDQMHSI